MKMDEDINECDIWMERWKLGVGGKKLNWWIGKKVWLAHVETSVQSPFKTMVSPLLQMIFLDYFMELH